MKKSFIFVCINNDYYNPLLTKKRQNDETFIKKSSTFCNLQFIFMLQRKTSPRSYCFTVSKCEPFETIRRIYDKSVKSLLRFSTRFILPSLLLNGHFVFLCLDGEEGAWFFGLRRFSKLVTK